MNKKELIEKRNDLIEKVENCPRRNKCITNKKLGELLDIEKKLALLKG